MTELHNKFHIGAHVPFKIIHISDSHLTLADERDGERKLELAKRRRNGFPNAEKNIEAAIEKSKAENAPLFCTGDITDFVSFKNLDAVKKYVDEGDIFTAAGNHEFSLYVGEAFEDDDYKNQSLEKVQAAFSNDIIFSSKIINGINFVAMDNSYYLIKSKHLDMLKNEVKKGYPVVLLLHVPLFTKDLFDYQRRDEDFTNAALMSVPEELMADYTDHRYRQQKADKETLEATEYITDEKAIKLILAGHLHYDYETVLPSGKPQIITGMDTMRIIDFD